MGALVLSRKAGQSINIGDNVVVTIDSIKGNLARVLIYAPDDVLILRTELADDKYDNSDLFSTVLD
jgi:carbon storage regulator